MLNSITILCSALAVANAKGPAATGANAGGWMVLEPWITPSLFYRFLGKDKDNTAMDSYTFCEKLGPGEGNKVMRAHWDAWFTEEHIKQLAERKVEIVRLPIGDWTLNPYGPYIGCMDGAADKIQWFYDTCQKYGLKVLLDVHAMKDSQNGYDNGGQLMDVTWHDKNHFSTNVNGKWWGTWHEDTKSYDPVNYDNFKWGLKVHENLLKRWGSHPAFYAFEPLNEPQVNPNLGFLKEFYRSSRKL
jgi:glucan 1,3-beta-glucosidase